MSITIRLLNTTRDELVNFILNEHKLDTGIPVHPMSVVNADLKTFNRMLALTTDTGRVYLEGEHTMKAYGINNWPSIVVPLQQCNVHMEIC